MIPAWTFKKSYKLRSTDLMRPMVRVQRLHNFKTLWDPAYFWLKKKNLKISPYSLLASLKIRHHFLLVPLCLSIFYASNSSNSSVYVVLSVRVSLCVMSVGLSLSVSVCVYSMCACWGQRLTLDIFLDCFLFYLFIYIDWLVDWLSVHVFVWGLKLRFNF